MNALERIVAGTRAEVQRRRADTPLGLLEREAAQRTDPVRPFASALSRPGMSVIAEHKRRSPSAGAIRDGVTVQEVVGAYERGGAAALSILTEPGSFAGSLHDLRVARTVVSLPVLRKDFIVDPYQLPESLAAGADAILLIVAALSPRALDALHAGARELGLAVLVEVHDAAELARAGELGAELIGINNRDLATLAVDTRRTFELLPLVPAGTTIVAESGFRSRAELDELQQAGVDAVLIGESLMRARDIEAAARALTE